ncbi:hypothetical protein Tco_0442138 [Tanacetum coccineum]
MANLEFCDKHNMFAYLKNPTRSEGFQEIVDFLNGCHIRYALTKNPTIYVSLIEKFWQTATIKTVDNGEQEIIATVDGKEFTITEAFVRRHLQLANVDGISVLPTTEIFAQLSLMGYVSTDDKLTFQKGKFSPQWRFLIHTILHCLSPKKTSWEQFSSNIATVIICLATNRTFNFSKLIFDEPIPNVVSSSHQKTQTPRQALTKDTELPQTSEPIPNVPDEAVYEEWDDKSERAITTAASLDAEQASGNINKTQSTIIPNVPIPQGIGAGGSPRCQEAMGGSIAQTRSDRVPTPPYNLPLLRVNTLGSDEGSMTLLELTVLCTTLSKKVESLEADLKQTKKVYGASYTKLIKKVKKLEKTVKSNQARRRAKIVVSDDEEDLEDSSKQGRMIEEIDQDAGVTLVTPTHISTAGRISTAEESVSTAGASMPVSTAGMVQEVNISIPSPVVIKDKGKAKMDESKPEKTKTKLQQRQERASYEAAVRLQEQLDEEERKRIARVHEEASSFNIEEWEDIQATIEADEELAQRIQAEKREKYSEAKKARLLAELINQIKRYFSQ